MKNIHVLPTDEPSRLFNCFGKLGIGDYVATRENIQVTNQHIYITNSEEIKEGDWCFYLNRFGGGNIICQAYKHFDDERMLYDDGTYNRKLGEGITPLNEDCKKIILTTDQDLIKDGVQAIDDDFLEWFIKNTSCEEVEVETRYVHYYKTGETFISLSKTPEFSSRNMQCIKIEPRYEIIIPIVEPKQETHICKYCKAETSQSDDECYAKPKQETLEEAAEVYANKKGDIPTTKLEDAIFKQGFIDGAKSDAAKNYWFKIFKKEFIVSLNGK